MDYYKQALEIKDEIITHRRFFHTNAEVGMDTPKAVEYITKTLESYGIKSQICAGGVTALIGGGEPVILLRADMDALPMEEQSGEIFASDTAKTAHTCGHDMHAAMLLGAAKLLKNNEDSFNGTVKLMFQPGEEILQGCKAMIAKGLLNNPVPSVALALHTGAGRILPGTFMYNSKEAMMASADNFTITVKGKGGHGAYQHLTVDPVNIAVHIYTALQSLVCIESPAGKMCRISIGCFSAGNEGNIIPETAHLKGSLRTDDENCRRHIRHRMEEITIKTAESFNGMAKVEFTSGTPALKCDKDFTEKVVKYIDELNIPDAKFVPDIKAGASEDFAYIATEVPSAYIYLSSGFDDARGEYTAHNPKVRFNEDCLPIGAAVYAQCADRWLKENAVG